MSTSEDASAAQDYRYEDWQRVAQSGQQLIDVLNDGTLSPAEQAKRVHACMKNLKLGIWQYEEYYGVNVVHDDE